MSSRGMAPWSTFTAPYVARSINTVSDEAMTVLIVSHIALQPRDFTVTISSAHFHKNLSRLGMRLTSKTNVT